MTAPVAPDRCRSPIRSIALVRPHDADNWHVFERARDQLEQADVTVHLASSDQLLDIEHGRCRIDAIATIRHPLNSARRVAARRDIPYITVGDHVIDLSFDLTDTQPTRTPVLDVTIDNRLPLIALHSISISTLAAAPDETSLFPEPSDHPRSCRHRCRQPAIVFVDRRATRVAPDSRITVRSGSHYLTEHQL